jgi:hypothetical protein
MAMPREGHLYAVLHIFGFLKIKNNSQMCFDPTVPFCDERAFKECNWKQFYGEAEEAVPSNAPEPQGKKVHLRMYVNSDHAGKKITRRIAHWFLCVCQQCTNTVVVKEAGDD